MQNGVGHVKISGDGVPCGAMQIGPVVEVLSKSLLTLFWFLIRTASGKATHFV